jgi:hypothetical protein
MARAVSPVASGRHRKSVDAEREYRVEWEKGQFIRIPLSRHGKGIVHQLGILVAHQPPRGDGHQKRES